MSPSRSRQARSTRRATLPAVLLTGVMTGLLTGLLTGVALIGSAGTASAHDRLVSSDPADGSALDAAPGAITLTFNEEVLDTGAQVRVTADGGDVGALPAQVDGVTVTASLPPDAPGGAYQVTWRVVSADGHPVEGTLGFTVAASTAQPAGAISPGDTASPADATSPAGAASPAGATSPAGTASAAPDSASSTPGGPRPGLWLATGVAVMAVVAAGIVWGRRRGAGAFGPPGQD